MLFRKSPKQPDHVFSHWFVPMEGVHFSTVEFYDWVEAQLASRQVPRLKSKRVEYHEGGRLSDKRLYLRLARERFSFEVCAVPFGTGFFFSLRFVEIPRGGWLMLLLWLLAAGVALALVAGFLYFLTFEATGTFWLVLGAVDAAAIVGLTVRGMRQRAVAKAAGVAVAPGWTMPDFDSILLRLPVIGEFYEWLRKDTFYRHDTRLMYQFVVCEVVRRRVEELIAARGVQLVRAYNYNPLLTDFYKRERLK
jgi:hypothetical protein